MKFPYRISLFFLLAIVVSACAGPAATATPPPAATSAPEWQTYTNSEAGFSIRYPSSWSVETLPDNNSGAMHGTSIKGSEGGVELYWGMGFGGACPQGMQPIKVAQGELQACYSKSDDGTEHWENIGKELPTTSFSARAYTSDTTSSSHDLLLQVISTLSFSS